MYIVYIYIYGSDKEIRVFNDTEKKNNNNMRLCSQKCNTFIISITIIMTNYLFAYNNVY